VINTHSDGDHCWGNQLFAAEEIIASSASARGMTHVSPASLQALQRLGRGLQKIPTRRTRQVGTWFAGMTGPYDFSGIRPTLPSRQFSGELTTTVGGRSLVLRELGPAHTDGDTVVFVPDARVLFTGDLLFIDSTPVIWAGPAENWIAAIDVILDYEADVIVPGHGPLATRDTVLRVRNYLEFVSEAALKWYAQGVPPRDAARRIVESGRFTELGFAQWDSPERVMTTVHTVYRGAGYAMRLRGTVQTVAILASQGELAFELPHATPRHMHSLDRR
jgi:glyoxylase-like metal-dependent hydrolase (beta-lactamase superfamily II)